jgi:hypothetical protein
MNELSDKAQKRLERARAEAHERVVERGIVQFRADRELMEKLLTISDHRKTAVGVLVRSWIAPIVRQEYDELPLKHFLLPTGKVLSRESSIEDLQQALDDFESGQLELSKKQRSSLQNWLLGRRQTDKPLKKSMSGQWACAYAC